MKKFYSNGKLLITGEYVVLDGALALTVPSKLGQSLEVQPLDEQIVQWTAFDFTGELWFKTEFPMEGLLGVAEKGPKDLSNLKKNKLYQILQKAHSLNSAVLKKEKGYQIKTRLDFPGDWGLGSSSTLLNNIAQWFEIDAFELQRETFGGSGYDIAAAQYDHPVSFQLAGEKPKVLTADFNPEFKDELFFVHLNRKQNSRESIAHYKQQPKELLEETVSKISVLTSRFINAATLVEFELLMEIHETLISRIIKTPGIKSQLFPDYPGAIKSLGGWGGDFILATGGPHQHSYFAEKGYKTILSYNEMVL